MVRPRLAAVIEVRPDERGEVPVDLVCAAYRASRGGTVALLLTGVSPAQVDRALDAVVPRESGVDGVIYCTQASLDRLLRPAGRPKGARRGDGGRRTGDARWRARNPAPARASGPARRPARGRSSGS